MSHFGKYRGQVVDTIDPLELGRLKVTVPSVLGEGVHSWAMPCVPYAGPQVGFVALPPVGAHVWVEFEEGSPDASIWTGCFWGAGELPGGGIPGRTKRFRTEAVTLELGEDPGSAALSVEVGGPAADPPLRLVLDADGLKLSQGAASMRLSPPPPPPA